MGAIPGHISKGDLKAQNLERLRRWRAGWAALRAVALRRPRRRFKARPKMHFGRVYRLIAGAVLEAHERSRVRGTRSLANSYQRCTQPTERDGHAGGVPIARSGCTTSARFSAVLTGLYPDIAQLSPGTLAGNALVEKIGPISQRLMSVPTTPGLVNAAAVENLKAILREFDQLRQEAAADNTGRRTRSISAAQRRGAGGTRRPTWATAPQHSIGTPKAASFSTRRTMASTAGESRLKAAALELRVTEDIDRATQRILGSLFDSDHPPEPLPMAMAYADLSQ